MNKKWEIYKVDEQKVNKIEQKGINRLLATILSNRGITEDEQIRIYLNPTREDFYNPYLMPDMEKAVDRIIKAIQEKQKVIIYGDYDVDGITSVTVLKSYLEERGLNVDYYIPNRLEEGYGLNKPAIESIANKNYNLMITVDCGISAIDEVKYAKELGLEVIVTDHHETAEEIPDAIAVVDAKRKDNQYPCRNLAGVGVVFKLIQAISQKLDIDEKEYLKYLDIVCIGTISDIVPLVDENRVIVKLGLKLLQQTKNIGLKTILMLSGYNKIDSSTISFGVAPRINACGRMGHQEEALKLFLSKDINEVNELAQILNEYNRQRQEKEKSIFLEAVEKIQANELDKNNVIIIDGEGWHHGVIGIVSSKITEMYFKPSILLCFEGEEGKGSGRSVPGFDLHEALQKCSNNLYKFGGHSMAVGLTVKKEQYEEFKKQLEEIGQEQKVDKIMPILKIDAQIDINEINKEMVESLKEMEPFGEENKTPLFVFKNLKIDSIRALSEGKHIKLTLKKENSNIIGAIGFNMGNLTDEYYIGDKVDVVGTLEINTYNGEESLQIVLKDIMKSI
ncbi:MAG: single-stranded-DNA-specific exonuclease RecJ [Clostridia bacterium]|nr:single-stranded-DNA-specific exonuclease RecJ [Clostridia bacterium]